MADADLVRALAARNKAGDLDAIPVEQEDTRPFLQRLKDALASGGWQDPQPGQRGTFVPSKINDQGKAEPAVPGIIQQPAESLQSLMTAPLSDLARMRDPDITRTLAEQSFDVASMLPAAGVAATKAAPKRMPERAMVAASNPDDLNTSAVLAAINAGNVDDALAKASARTPTTQPPRPPGYDRAPFQPDWPHWSLEYGLNARTHLGQRDIEMIDPRGIQPTETGVNGARIINGQLSDAGDAMLGRPASAVDALADGLRANVGQDAYVRPDGRKFYSNPDDPTTAAILAAMQGQEKPKGITAYHGSPHDFDRFDMSKIGTGEGAQAYGHGLYFAENEDVARRYRDDLSKHSAKWVGEQQPTPLQRRIIDDLNAEMEQSGTRVDLGRFRESLAESIDIASKAGNSDRVAKLKQMIEEIDRSGSNFAIDTPGRMYEVRLNVDPDKVVDLDAPWNKQQENIRSALADLVRFPVRDTDSTIDVIKNIKHDLVSRTQDRAAKEGKSFSWVDEENARNGKMVADRITKSGAPAARYLDKYSREAAGGTSNYVVFDDALIEILKKYSNPADPTTAAILALLTQQQGAQPQQ